MKHTGSFARVVAKYVVQSLVWTATARASEEAVNYVVDVEEDSILDDGIGLAAAGIGFAVSMKLTPKTDQLVDMIADKWNARKTDKVVQVVTPQ